MSVFTTNPISVTAVMGSSYKAQGGLPTNQPINITEIYWVNPITVGDSFILNDQSGTLIRTGRCEVGNQSQLFQFIPAKRVSDFIVPTLVSGTLYISYY